MIETRLTPTETRWLLGRLGLEPAGDSPLREPVAGAGDVPADSTAEGKLQQALTGRGLLLADRSVNPFAAAALAWLARPEKVWSLSLFGRGGVRVLHLAFKEDAAVECLREPDTLRLRFPLPAAEARRWLALHVAENRP